VPVEVGADSLRDEAGVARGVTVGHARRRESSEIERTWRIFA
jgi:hypothetical protein